MSLNRPDLTDFSDQDQNYSSLAFSREHVPSNNANISNLVGKGTKASVNEETSTMPRSKGALKHSLRSLLKRRTRKEGETAPFSVRPPPCNPLDHSSFNNQPSSLNFIACQGCSSLCNVCCYNEISKNCNNNNPISDAYAMKQLSYHSNECNQQPSIDFHDHKIQVPSEYISNITNVTTNSLIEANFHNPGKTEKDGSDMQVEDNGCPNCPFNNHPPYLTFYNHKPSASKTCMKSLNKDSSKHAISNKYCSHDDSIQVETSPVKLLDLVDHNNAPENIAAVVTVNNYAFDSAGDDGNNDNNDFTMVNNGLNCTNTLTNSYHLNKYLKNQDQIKFDTYKDNAISHENYNNELKNDQINDIIERINFENSPEPSTHEKNKNKEDRERDMEDWVHECVGLEMNGETWRSKITLSLIFSFVFVLSILSWILWIYSKLNPFISIFVFTVAFFALFVFLLKSTLARCTSALLLLAIITNRKQLTFLIILTGWSFICHFIHLFH